jgi:DNA-binding MarR family transcriptional regulator
MAAPVRSEEVSPDVRDGIRVLARLARVAEQACQSVGISLPQYRLLVSISGRPQRASELARRVGVSRPTLTSLVDGLEQGGLLRRAPVPHDRRGIQLVPTAAGLAAIGRAEVAVSERIRQLLDEGSLRLAVEVVGEIGRALEHERGAAT